MREKSQLEDMRAALQGDLERARERRGATLLDPEPESAPELDPEPQTEVPGTPEEAPEVVVQVADAPEPDPEPTPRRRFLWFLRD
jgi:hypothetical protein